MHAPFVAASIKIERSKRHLQELEREMSSYFARGGAKIVVERDDEMIAGMGYGEFCAFKYRESEPVPSEWSAVIGDAIHNMRSSLDLMASDIHRITGGKPEDTQYVHFPFCKDRHGLADMIRSRRLSGIGRDFLDAIHAIAPYRGGNDGLRALHDLDVMDKHQALLPTLSVAAIPWPTPVDPKTSPPDFRTPLTIDGQRLFIMPRPLCQIPYGTQIKAEFIVIFDVGAFRGSPVVEQLTACLRSVEAILSRFQSIASKRESKSGVGSINP